MTLPPEKIGDKGQRFEVTYWDSDKQMRRTFGWADKMEAAEQFADVIRLHPTMGLAEIKDRVGGFSLRDEPSLVPGARSRRSQSETG